ncbi:Lysophospholipase [Tolypocladium paradoxum]|uniref:Lysophospholipase n=1 Tax=Tolypocladium paradoxum TaxID=94208 RepID=A0A2S4KZ34_9HYPO|nr:Lysophospholipase [Tolypocladium paradoxum]
MTVRDLIVVVLYHTNEELSLEPESPRLDRGEWMTDTAESQPPPEIRAGESGMWRCESRHAGAGIEGLHIPDHRVRGERQGDIDLGLTLVRRMNSQSESWAGAGGRAIAVFVLICQWSAASGTRQVLAKSTTYLAVICAVEPRAVPNAPDNYAPGPISCPAPRPTIRRATTLSPEETAWLPVRGNATSSALKDLLSRVNISGIDTNAYIDNIVSGGNASALLPRIGIAISGGGYWALMTGAGAIAAFDNRTSTSSAGKGGQLGGVLQAATYLSGLSGGSWVVGSLYVQNFTTVDAIIFSSSGFLSKLWQFGNSIIKGSFNLSSFTMMATSAHSGFDNIGPAGLSVGEYYRELYQSVQDKLDAGFNKSITDYWGRALSYQLVNASDGGPAYTFSSIAEDVEFVQAKAPMPIIVALERPPGQLQIGANATVFEFNPWEMGSYDPGAAAFAPLKYVGSNFTNGTIAGDSNCIAGVDNAGFVMGTSSSLFNQALLQIDKASNVPDFLLRAINETLGRLGEENRDIASWPNPFYKYGNARDNINADSRILTLVDGGEDLQNIPLQPLTLSERHVDVIFAVDGSADTPTSWPNGTALVATYQRSKSGFSANNSNSMFPPVPDQNTFVNLGLNKRPTFFGCDNSSGALIVYLPNAPYSFHSNVSTFDLEYSDSERDQIVGNGYNVATMGNGTVDSAWPSCVGCAVLARSLVRTRTAMPANCVDCFARYCWNGTANSTTPATYEPEQIIASGAGGRPAAWMGGTAFVFCVVVLLLTT